MTQAVAVTMLRRSSRREKRDSSNRWMAALPQLELMLWSGTAMLIVDHIINGEVTWMYPFFTALGEEGGAWTMLREMLTVGVPMSVVVTVIWALKFVPHLEWSQGGGSHCIDK